MAKKKKVLVVDDEKAIAEYVTTLLDLHGYETRTAGDGREAVMKARDFFPDLILLDVMLPHLNGFDACKILRADPALKDTPVVMLTSLNQMGDAEKAFKAGANDFLTKPFETERLLHKVRKFLGDVP